MMYRLDRKGHVAECRVMTEEQSKTAPAGWVAAYKLEERKKR